MLGIPLISDYIHRVVKPQEVADSVDYLNYYCTSLMLAFAAFAISAKQYFGSPIQCWVPMEFRGGWEKYAEDYCFIQNSYYVPFEEEIPEAINERRDQISYYRWVPIMLALQALMFFAPNFFWSVLYKQTAIQPQILIKEARKCAALRGRNRDAEIRNLAEYIGDTVSVFTPRREISLGIARTGRNATILYLFTKFLYAANIISQFYLINRFLGGGYCQWSIETMQSVLAGREWTESEIFPRVIMCDFQVRRLGNLQRHTVQCVIMMNMINEKLYLLLFGWLICVGCCTIINFFYFLIVMTVPNVRAQLVLWNIKKREWKMSGFGSDDMKRFVDDFLRPDGVLLLKFISEHVGFRISRELVNELIRIYANQVNLSMDNDSDAKQESSVSSDEKAPLSNGKADKSFYGNLGKNIKPLYSSKGDLPLPSQMRAPSVAVPTYETAPALEDFIDGAGETLPLRAMARARAVEPQNQASENVYGSPGSQQRQNTPTEV